MTQIAMQLLAAIPVECAVIPIGLREAETWRDLAFLRFCFLFLQAASIRVHSREFAAKGFCFLHRFVRIWTALFQKRTAPPPRLPFIYSAFSDIRVWVWHRKCT